jgi:hypothetical protein
MIFNCVVVLLVVIMTSYLASQGTLTAALSMIAAGFASLIAMATFEPLALVIAGWGKPDYARPVAFLAIFLVAYLICKLAGDNLVPRNLKLPKAVDRGVGAVFGLVAGLLAVGTTCLGVQMLPLKSTLLGYDRFPTERRMGGDQPGTVAQANELWLMPDTFTMKFWNLASGRGLGGKREFESVHPNLANEAYGYRNVIQYGQHQTLFGGLEVTGAYLVKPDDKAAMERYHIQEGKQGYFVRCEISGGVDTDSFFRITATEIRIVTDKNKQYYPIGYMEQGTRFTPVDLANGHTADDEPAGKAIEDWIFQFDAGETPQVLEVKQLARVDLTAIPDDAPIAPLKNIAAYPHKEYKQNEGSVTVTVLSGGKPMPNVKVLLLRPTPTRRDLAILQDAYNRTKEVLTQFANNEGGWKDPPENNAHFPKESFAQAQSMMRESAGKALDEAINVRDQLPHMYLANTTSNPASTPGVLQTYTDTKVIPALEHATNTLITEGVTDASGKVKLEHCPAGNWVLFAATKDDAMFSMWCPQQEIKAKTDVQATLDSSRANFKFPPNFGGGR